MAAPNQTYRVGDRINKRYRVVSVHLEGGFGTVYICWDEHLKRRVAIKAIPLTTEVGVPLNDAMEDALAEARTAGFLSHPSIVTMLDIHVDPYTAYLIMENIDGCTLADLLREPENLSYNIIAHILDSTASALSYAHAQGVLHLDIKPGNILIDRSGNVKLADFGMSRLASAAGYAGARGGTVGYMPPEQLQGLQVDERADNFACAAVVLEMICGEAPFRAPTIQESINRIFSGFTLPSYIDPELSSDLDDLFITALNPISELRPVKIEHFANDAIDLLGDTRSGKKELKALVESLYDDEPEATSPEELPNTNPLLQRPLILRGFPNAHTALMRVAAAACGAWFCWLVLDSLLKDAQLESAVITLVCGIFAGVAPAAVLPISSLWLLIGSILAGFPLLGVAQALICFGVWMWYARRDPQFSLAAVAPAALGPLGLIAITSYLGGSLKGTARSAGATLLSFLPILTIASISAEDRMLGVGVSCDAGDGLYRTGTHLLANIMHPAASGQFISLITTPSVIAFLIAATLCAPVLSWVIHRGHSWVVGGLAGLGVLIVEYLFILVAKGMETGYFSAVEPLGVASFLVISFILYFCTYVLLGLPEHTEVVLTETNEDHLEEPQDE